MRLTTARPDVLAVQLVLLGCPEPVREFPFEPDRGARGFRLDLAFPPAPLKIAVEYEGGITRGGPSHTSVQNLLRDCRKASLLASLGWLYFRATAPTVDDGSVAELIAACVRGRLTPATRAAYEHWLRLYAASRTTVRPRAHTRSPREDTHALRARDTGRPGPAALARPGPAGARRP